MEVRQHDEARRVLTRDLELHLPLKRDVIDGRPAIRHVQLGRGVKVEEVRAAKVAAYEREPVDRPERERPYARTRGARITEANEAPREPRVHRPLSRRRAKRSGSLAFLIARCAPLMS